MRRRLGLFGSRSRSHSRRPGAAAAAAAGARSHGALTEGERHADDARGEGALGHQELRLPDGALRLQARRRR